MTLPYEQAAYNNEPVPDSLNPFDKLAYMALRGLYSSYRNGEISLEQSKKEKRIIVNVVKGVKALQEINNKIARLWKRIEAPARDYAKSVGTPEGDRFYAEVYNLGENWRLKRKCKEDK